MKEIKFTKEEKQFWENFINTMKLVSPESKFIKEKGIEKNVEEGMNLLDKIGFLIEQNLE